VQKHHRGLYFHNFSSLSTPQTSNTAQTLVISSNTLTNDFAVIECTSDEQEDEYRKLVDTDTMSLWWRVLLAMQSSVGAAASEPEALRNLLWSPWT